jgi:hypothetical protein
MDPAVSPGPGIPHREARFRLETPHMFAALVPADTDRHPVEFRAGAQAGDPAVRVA